MKVELKAEKQPVEEVIRGVYDKQNRDAPWITYTTTVTLYDGELKGQKVVSLARRRSRMSSQLEPSLMNIEVDELDGLIGLLCQTRDALVDRNIETRFVR